jgi:hypothetical protein
MEYRVSYEYSLASTPHDFIAHVPLQILSDVPANIPLALIPEYITDLILIGSPHIGKVRNLRVL